MTDIRSTYRLQITPEFTLDDAAGVCDYIAALGADCVYLSPILASTPGSDHGYDCVDPTQVDPQRGGEAGWERFVAAARAAGLKIIIDIVPNHMGISVPASNPAWWSVLRDGQESDYAAWFDIDWARAPIVVPVLGSDATAEEFSLDGDVLRYFDHELPVAPGSVAPGDGPLEVAEKQHYRLVDWRLGNTTLNYRRFFAVTTLAGVRIEDAEVYAATHERILRMIADGQLDGLRVDHPDGLVDPATYMARLREALGPDRWLIGEKILAVGEPLPRWDFDGTVGYDAMGEVMRVLLDPAAEGAATTRYTTLTGDFLTSEEHDVRGKLQAAEELFGAELHRLAALAPELPAIRVRRALATLAAHFDVYRTYLPDDAAVLDAALQRAAAAEPALAPTLDALSPRLHDAADELAQRFQQLTGAVTAKGVEDTSFYRYTRCIALNEVGGDPGLFGSSVEEFHAQQAHRQQHLPLAMTALATHDTKRGEDVRAALLGLPEIDEQWDRFATLFLRRTAVPNAAFAYLLAQTLVAVGPVERERLHAYAEKAMREAHDGTSWTDPNPEFENAVHAAVDLAYDDAELRAAWDAIRADLRPLAWSNALSHKFIQLMMPGIPDVYRGSERWEDTLVDPDNRRPVDFAALADLPEAAPAVEATGVAKQWIVAQVLRQRRDHPERFCSYTPVTARGYAADHVVAFDRGGAIAVATRLPGALAANGGWARTELELDGTWTDQLTGRSFDGPVPLERLLERYPVALLTR